MYGTDRVSHVGRLSRIQQQVLQDVSKRLPPEMQILDVVLRLLSRNERMSILRQAASGQGGNDVPPCDIKRVRGAALQLVSDMEEQDAVPDRYIQRATTIKFHLQDPLPADVAAACCVGLGHSAN